MRPDDVLFVAFYASAELGCYRVLGWPMPERILDLFIEFRDRTNGLPTPAGSRLLGALAYFGLDAMGAIEKRKCRKPLAMAPGEGASRRRKFSITAESDVEALIRLLARHAAADRSTASLAPRPLHGRRRRHGAPWHPDRRRRCWHACGKAGRVSRIN